MKRKLTVLLLVLAMLLCGCDRKADMSSLQEKTDAAEAVPTIEETVPPTVAPDGDPENVTCKGSYTGSGNMNAVVADAGAQN